MLRELFCDKSCHDPDRCPNGRRCAYGQIFAPKQTQGPSGFGDPPRPFSLRAAHLDGATIARGQRFHLDIHVFDLRPETLSCVIAAFSRFAEAGFGPARTTVRLARAWALDELGTQKWLVSEGSRLMPVPEQSIILLPLAAQPGSVRSIRVEFVTPVELKGWIASPTVPLTPFSALYCRLRDRIGALMRLYDGGAPDMDYRLSGERSKQVRTVGSHLRYVFNERHSGRTLATHPLGGMVGWIQYEGDLSEFLPVLRIGAWVGVGRQTTWGNGEMRLSPAD